MGDVHCEVFVTGLGVAIESDDHPAWRSLCHQLEARLPDAVGRAEPSSVAPARDRRILTTGDLQALHAASLAIATAGGESRLERLDRWACVCASTSKLTPDVETALPYVQFRKDDDSPDTLAYKSAVESGEVQVDPMGLLRCLDNSVCWWLCKRYGFGGVNLQLGQSLAPDCCAFVEAIDLIASGSHDGVLVGGYETVAQSAVQLTGLHGEPYDEDPEHAGGGAVFFLLESAERASAELALARLSLSADWDLRSQPPESDFDAPALAYALALVSQIVPPAPESGGQASNQPRPNTEIAVGPIRAARLR